MDGVSNAELGINPEAEMKTKPLSGFDNEPRTKKLGESLGTDIELTPERKQQLEIEIAKTAEFFNGSGKKWFLAGGTALELASGGLTRDHQDVDVAMYSEDLIPFFDYATKAGYRFERPMGEKEFSQYKQLYGHVPEIMRVDERRKITWVKIQDAQELSLGHNAFANATNPDVPLPNGFEVIALQRDSKTGGVIFGADSNVILPPGIYENAPKYTAMNEQEVPLTPKEVQLMYKIYDGRQKDFEDIRRSLPSLSIEEKQTLDNLLGQANIEFRLPNGTIVPSLDHVLSVASKDTTQDHEKILQAAETDFKQATDTIYEAASQSTTEEEFYQEVQQAFGGTILTVRAKELAQIAEYFFGSIRPTLEQFEVFAREAYGNDFIKQRVLGTFLNTDRWQVQKKASV